MYEYIRRPKINVESRTDKQSKENREQRAINDIARKWIIVGGMLRNMRRFIKTDYECLLIRRNICALIKEVNQQKDMALISVETCRVRCLSLLYLLCLSIWRTAWHARASVLPPRTRCMLHTHTHTRSCAPIMQIFESDKWTENQLQICISVNCGTISAPHALQILKKETQKITLCLNEILKFSFFCVLFENYFR